MTTEIASGWQIHVDEGPDWLFLRLRHRQDEGVGEAPIAAGAWAIAEERGKTRIVFELDDATPLTSQVVGQLILLHKRAELADGKFRICGFPPHAYQTLRTLRMADRFPNYASREDAVLGHLPVG